jgi:phenylpyruvate tautomerase PptA (4-oxalocrotonate tautomerase family)
MNQLGSNWQSLGVASWLYRPSDVMIYVDMSKWQNMSLAQKQKLINKVGKDMESLVSKHGQDPKKLYIMFHSAQNQDIMIATYSGSSGGQIQQ